MTMDYLELGMDERRAFDEQRTANVNEGRPEQPAWFRNFYNCPECATEWEDHWSCMVDDDCPACKERSISPDDAEEIEIPDAPDLGK